MTLESLNKLDQQLLLFFNGSESLYLDRLAEMLTWGFTWVPLYVALFYLVVKNNETMLQIVLVMGCVALCILIASGVGAGIVKPLVARPRPIMDPYFKYMVDVAGTYSARGFSFFSSHAANTMALAVFCSLLVRDRLLTIVMLIWSLLNCWTRLYLGVHYPGDVFVGIVWGVVSGIIGYLVFRKIYFKISPKINYISSHYTSTGYSAVDIDVVMIIVVATLAVVTVLSLLVF